MHFHGSWSKVPIKSLPQLTTNLVYNYTELVVPLLNIKVTVSSLIKINVLIMQKSTEMLQNLVKKWPAEKKIYILLENLTSLEQGVHTILHARPNQPQCGSLSVSCTGILKVIHARVGWDWLARLANNPTGQ